LVKLANPWKCDASSCGTLRANDTNHWMIVGVHVGDGGPEIVISRWSETLAGLPGAKHACGIDCGLKVTAQLIVEKFFPNEVSSAGKEANDGQQK
jgi:hypothetical protein